MYQNVIFTLIAHDHFVLFFSSLHHGNDCNVLALASSVWNRPRYAHFDEGDDFELGRRLSRIVLADLGMWRSLHK